jgi:hypothetical protein
VTPFERREAVRAMHEEGGLAVDRACKAARLSRAAYYRQRVDRASRDSPVMEALNSVLPGSEPATKNDLMMRWVACPRRYTASGHSQRKTLILICLLDVGAYGFRLVIITACLSFPCAVQQL